MRRHIVHIITGLDIGGAERSLFNLLTSDSAIGFTHSVVSLGDHGHYGPILQQRGISVHALGLRNGAKLLQAPLRLRALMRWKRPEIVQGWMYHGNLIATLAASFSPSPTVLAWNVRQSLYSLQTEKHGTQWTIRGLRSLSTRPKAIIYNSHHSRAQHEDFGFSLDHGVVIPNGFDADYWKPDALHRATCRLAWGVEADAPVAGYIGRLHPQKDVPTFLRASAIALAENPRLHIVMVGDGLSRDNPALAHWLSDLPPQRFHALGRRDDIAAILAGFDFFCLSSSSEAFPNVLGEAMATGLSCIATNVGDCARLIEGNGRIVAVGDVRNMAEAMGEMARMEAARRVNIGKAARARIMASYSLGATVGTYAHLYDSLLKRVG